MYPRLLALLLLVIGLGGCATRRDLREARAGLQAEIETLRSSQRAMLEEIQRQNRTILDSLNAKDIRQRGDLANRLIQIERQLVQIQELTGQSQQRLSALQQEMRQREEALRAAAAAGAAAPAPAGNPDELFAAAQSALQRGSFATARAGFEEFLRTFPQHARAVDAQLGIGESHEKAKEPQRALEAYQRVVEQYTDSPRAPTALLRSALIEIGRGERTRARTILNQLIAAYPRSPEAASAKEQLQKLRR